MSAKKQSSRLEAARDAATGYAVVVLALICFIIVLIILMAGVRIIFALGGPSPATVTTATVAKASAAGLPSLDIARTLVSAIGGMA